MVEVIPAVLPTSSEDLEKKLSLIPRRFHFIQVDITDPHIFVDPLIDFEVHLMVDKSDEVLEEWLKSGAKRIITHKPSQKLLSLKPEVEIGLGVELQTPLEEILPLVNQVDFVQLMSIEEIGRQGNEFSPKIFDRIKELKKAFPEVVISIDGGVSLDNALELIHLGAERLVVGSAIFGQNDPEEAYEKFLQLT
ncbi:MAG: hypothetical protein WDZ64_01990 [Parcubacteria group bacterium]